MKFEEYNFTNIAPPLQGWFSFNARKLPWREEQTPYHVWVSEIMLQQTRVEAVVHYYRRFLETLPDVETLADAPEEILLKLWEGLGYYSRVRNMQKAAGIIMDAYNGVIPDTTEELLKLPGIGNYTAGAIASLAYGKRVPAVDGNVLRVAARLAGDPSDIMDATTKKRLEACLRLFYSSTEHAEHKTDPRKINQGLMEIGALVCLPNGKPHCGKCPLRMECNAFLNGDQETLPVRKPKKERKVESRTVLLIEAGSRILLHKRPPSGLLAGMWEFPNFSGELSAEEADRYVRKLGLVPLRFEPTAPAKHIFTHIEWHMTGYRIRVSAESPCTEETSVLSDSCRTLQDGYLFASRKEILTGFAVPSAFSTFLKYLPE